MLCYFYTETSASLAICIKHLSGNLRLQLSRYPCTHWAASFLEKPAITVSVDTSFQSRPLPQLGSVIVNQFYKSIKKKHTFPNYKLRYTPFYAFHSEKNTPSVPFVAGAQPVVGRINVTIVSCTRLLLPQYDKGKQGVHRVSRVVFATISLDAETCEGREAIKNEEPVEKLSFAAASAGLLLTTPNKLKQAFFDDSEDKSVEQDSGIANDEPTRINKPEIKQSTTKNEKLAEKTRNLALSVPVNPVNEPSYMMITRSFSALLYEKPNTESDVEKSTIVQVGSINMNNSSKGKPNISEGDIILSINGSEVKSLGQAIAIINDIRLKKKSFQFKVQRSRNYQPPVKLANLKKEPSSSPTTNSLPGPSKPTPPTLVESEASDTESDFSDLDYMDDHLEPPLFDDTRQIPFLGNPLNQSRNRYTKTGNYKGILIKKKSGKKSNSNMSIFDKDECLDFAKITPQSTNEILKTTLSHCDQPELQWNAETYSLKLKEDQAYLNIRFWYQEIPLSPGNKKEVRMLLGNIGIRLCHLSAQCNMLTSRKLTQKYKISSPLNSSKDESIRWNLNESFTQRLNFRRDYCYGDATIVSQLKD
ncbi:unnamed protein product [Clavelina lepadiformis]|uniref:PDZD8 N-terminal domain-containing protein n=1 Tax=Clavelina lepadiformis TaxID=159417 RepID=A0ABP0GD36_CLALP